LILGLVLFCLVVFIYRGQSFYILASSNTDPVLGQRLQIVFSEPVIKSSVLNHLTIRPSTPGEFIWSRSASELDFLPAKAFIPGKLYRVTISNIVSFSGKKKAFWEFNFWSPSFAQAPKKNSVLTASAGSLPSIREVYRRANGQAIYLPPARIKEGSYIDLDLRRKILITFRDGQALGVYEILATGPPWSPTPRGHFQVRAKYRNAFSRHSHVWMPWSINFSGPYFIHEVPIWPSGKRLYSKYSGGCVRLKIGQAEKVYNFAQIGMAVIIHN